MIRSHSSWSDLPPSSSTTVPLSTLSSSRWWTSTTSAVSRTVVGRLTIQSPLTDRFYQYTIWRSGWISRTTEKAWTKRETREGKEVLHRPGFQDEESGALTVPCKTISDWWRMMANPVNQFITVKAEVVLFLLKSWTWVCVGHIACVVTLRRHTTLRNDAVLLDCCGKFADDLKKLTSCVCVSLTSWNSWMSELNGLRSIESEDLCYEFTVFLFVFLSRQYFVFHLPS